MPINLVRETFDKGIFVDFYKLSNLPTEKQAKVNVRLRQSFFRRAVLSNYDNKCCISGIDIPELLVASHIVPWAKDKFSRIDPQNGLSLSVLHDKAFDKGFITISTDYRIEISKYLLRAKSVVIQQLIHDIRGKEINIDTKFLPKEKYLEWHNKNVFLG